MRRLVDLEMGNFLKNQPTQMRMKEDIAKTLRGTFILVLPIDFQSYDECLIKFMLVTLNFEVEEKHVDD